MSLLAGAGVRLVAGVPCTHLQSIIDASGRDEGIMLVPATNEGDAVAVAAGATLGGYRSLVFMQNSGLGNAVSPLTSLTTLFNVPVLLAVSWRGEPDGPADEPQHAFMGAVTTGVLDLLEIPWIVIDDPVRFSSEAKRAYAEMLRTGLPAALLIRPGSLAGRPPEGARARTIWAPADTLAGGPPVALRPTLGPRDALVDEILRAAGTRDVLVASTGYIGRAVYGLDDRPGNLYIVGSMGCASAVGLGLALSRTDRRVIVVDGDGSVLMRLGMLPLIGYMNPPNLLHVVLDNGSYDSTGGQPTVSERTDLAAIARASGYSSVECPTDMAELPAMLRIPCDGARFVHVLTRPEGGVGLPRPAISPPENARRFQRWLGQDGGCG